LDTYKGLDLGKAYTSGKECLPCLITTGDILHFMQRERERRGSSFNAEDYIYLMPESDGPCRFGMYNKYQRIVLDSFPELRRVKIGYITSVNDYSLDGMIERGSAISMRKAAYFSIVAGDILDRLACRVRPYERVGGMADDLIETSMHELESVFETRGVSSDLYTAIVDKLEDATSKAVEIIDPTIPRKPLVGIVGEIYLRAHDQANHDIIRALEKYGAEVVNTSFAEWVNYISYHRLREAKIDLFLNARQLHLRKMIDILKKMVAFKGNLLYEQFFQRRMYKRVLNLVDLIGDHRVAQLEKLLNHEEVFSFDVGTEACLSIAGIISYARNGYNGVVNVYPFTCMPGSVTSSIVKPLTSRLGIPYLDVPCDVNVQPGREAAVRTFMYQVSQHFDQNRRKSNR
jgi:predicted nucleotide-binding protein (sugar kinase/HSP70/actin superfamily)